MAQKATRLWFLSKNTVFYLLENGSWPCLPTFLVTRGLPFSFLDLENENLGLVTFF